jgi:hypothetical protein
VTRTLIDVFMQATHGQLDRYKEWNEYVRD